MNGNASDDKDNCATTKHFGPDEVLTIWKIVYIIYLETNLNEMINLIVTIPIQNQRVFNFLILVVRLFYQVFQSVDFKKYIFFMLFQRI